MAMKALKWTGREAFTSRPSPHGYGHCPCRKHSANAATGAVQSLMGNQCSPDCRRGTGVVPDPRSANNGSVRNFFSASIRPNFHFSRKMGDQKINTKSKYDIFFNKISTFYASSSPLSIDRRYEGTCSKILYRCAVLLVLMRSVETKATYTHQGTKKHFLSSWPKIFVLRPVLPFDHHPHALRME